MQRFERPALLRCQLPPRRAQAKPAPLPPAPVVEWWRQWPCGFDHRNLQAIGDAVANARGEEHKQYGGQEQKP
jgi:hypothetical protein